MSFIVKLIIGGAISFITVTNIPKKHYDIIDKNLFIPFGKKCKTDKTFGKILDLGKITYKGIYSSYKEIKSPPK